MASKPAPVRPACAERGKASAKSKRVAGLLLPSDGGSAYPQEAIASQRSGAT